MTNTASHQSTLPWKTASSAWGWLAFLGVLSLLVYLPVLSRLVAVWLNDEEMAHALFVPLVAGYAVWQNRAKLGELTPGIYPAALVLCLVAGGMRVLGVFSGEVLLMRLGWLLTWIGLLSFFFGTAILRLLSFPLFLLLFAIPIPRIVFTPLTAFLQKVASILSQRMLDTMGYTVIRQGNILELPNQIFSVAEACSGIRSLFSIGFLVLVYIYFMEDRTPAKWIVAALTIPVTVFVNALRIVLTGMVSQQDPVLAMGLFHASAGWVLSLIGFVMLMGIHAVAMRLYQADAAAGPVVKAAA
jgi:exosortase